MPTATPSLLRGLVIADAAVTALGLLLAFFSGMMTDDSATSSDSSGQSLTLGLLCFLLLTLVPAQIGGWVGIYRLRNWGRWLYVGSVCVGHLVFVLTSLFDFSAGWKFPDSLASIAGTIGGVIIGLVFFSSLDAEFRPAIDAQVEPAPGTIGTP